MLKSFGSNNKTKILPTKAIMHVKAGSHHAIRSIRTIRLCHFKVMIHKC